jgi:hypothetical protein
MSSSSSSSSKMLSRMGMTTKMALLLRLGVMQRRVAKLLQEQQDMWQEKQVFQE